MEPDDKEALNGCAAWALIGLVIAIVFLLAKLGAFGAIAAHHQ